MSQKQAQPDQDIENLKVELNQLLTDLPNTENRKLIGKALAAIAQISKTETDRLDWKLIVGSLQDTQKALQVFHPYRHIRKVSIFGSARTLPDEPEYLQALTFAQSIVAQGFMVLTGAGGGIMSAANAGAGRDRSFGLNIDLPFEQNHNDSIDTESRLVNFKYFFTRKLFFMRESDAIALFPGGFGTQDEFFECLTLCQTGKATPRPLVLIDKQGGDYWQNWDAYIKKCLLERNLISPEDHHLYTITDDIAEACHTIANFYSVYHSCRWVQELFVIRLNCEIADPHLERLNQNFSDLLTKGKIIRSSALVEENGDLHSLPRLVMYFNQCSYGRLHELVLAINDTSDRQTTYIPHPEQK